MPQKSDIWNRIRNWNAFKDIKRSRLWKISQPALFLPDLYCLPCRDISHSIVALAPDRNAGRIVDGKAIRRKNKAFIRLHIIIDFKVGRVPNVLSAGNKIKKFFNHLPVVMLLKFIAVAPEVVKPGIPLRNLFHKFPCERHKLGIVMVAGGPKPQPILWQHEAMVGMDSARVDDARKAQKLNDFIVVRSVRVRAAAHQNAELLRCV